MSPASCFQHDRDLLRATPEFARLRDVTQVMAPGEPGEFHTRHSHSLQVARIGRALAEALLRDPATRQLAEQAGGLHPDVVEAAALAHDLGHPPFGHDAEDELDRLLIAAGIDEGFEANAQSFRVVCELAGAGAPGGLNLTRATLAGILKYPWLRGGHPDYPGKWGAYASEAAIFHWVAAALPEPGQPGLEARVMDWADLLAYAVYDFEDFVRSGDIPMDRLRATATERQWLLDLVYARRRVPPTNQPVYAATLDRLLAECPRPAGDARRFRNALRCYANHLVAEAISGVALVPTRDGVAIETAPEQEAVIMLTEGLTWHYVIDSPLLAPQRAAQRQIIRELFLSLVDTLRCPDCYESLPPALRRALHHATGPGDTLRLIADCIASMPEREAVAYHRLLVEG
ncbi:MAG: dNTP triphosphohydrolase [Thermomicrobiales bacterium]